MSRRLSAAPPPPAAAPAGPVSSPRPDREVWSRALRIAGGDAARCRVLDPRTVLVVNRPH